MVWNIFKDNLFFPSFLIWLVEIFEWKQITRRNPRKQNKIFFMSNVITYDTSTITIPSDGK